MLSNRRELETICADTRFGRIHASIGYDPKTGRVCEMFFSGRGPTGHGVDDILMELGIGLSKALQQGLE